MEVVLKCMGVIQASYKVRGGAGAGAGKGIITKGIRMEKGCFLRGVVWPSDPLFRPMQLRLPTGIPLSCQSPQEHLFCMF